MVLPDTQFLGVDVSMDTIGSCCGSYPSGNSRHDVPTRKAKLGSMRDERSQRFAVDNQMMKDERNQR